MNQRLEMTFLTADDRKVRLSVPNCDDTLEAADILTAMNGIIAAGIFEPGGSALVTADSARFVTTQVITYDFA